MYRRNDACLKWWQQAGGFSISFPNYTWYRDEKQMACQIALDNMRILEFVSSRGINLVRHRNMARLLRLLHLQYSPGNIGRISQTEFERRFGFGDQTVSAIEAACNAAARLASIAVV